MDDTLTTRAYANFLGKYKVLTIGKKLDAERSLAVAINSQGQVAMQAQGRYFSAYLWTSGEIVDLTPQERGMSCWVSGLNDFGTVVGSIGPDREHRTACFWKDGKLTQLRSLDNGNTYATGITNSGIIYGVSYNRHKVARGVYWRQGEISDVGFAGTNTFVSGVSANGPYVVYAENRGNPLSQIHWDYRAENLPEGCVGLGINGKVHTVGEYHVPDTDETRPFVYANQTLTKFPTLGGKRARAQGINQRDWIVGQSTLLGSQGQHAFLWCNNFIYNLNMLLKSAVNLTIINATAINNNNEIVGAARVEGKEIACLLVPEK